MIFKYGTCPNLPIDFKLGKQNINISLTDLIKTRDLHFKHYSEYYIQKGKKRDTRSFQVGEKVLIYNDHSKRKIDAHWCEDYVIKAIIHPNAYLVQNKTSVLRVNKERLKHDTRQG
ncbi:hypothetical protein GVAV_002825 [Gurleya vavrai]